MNGYITLCNASNAFEINYNVWMHEIEHTLLCLLKRCRQQCKINKYISVQSFCYIIWLVLSPCKPTDTLPTDWFIFLIDFLICLWRDWQALTNYHHIPSLNHPISHVPLPSSLHQKTWTYLMFTFDLILRQESIVDLKYDPLKQCTV